MIKEDKISEYLKENEEEIKVYSRRIHTIGNPIKFKILLILFNNGRCHVKRIAEILEMTHSACSQHISALKDQGLIYGEKEGKNVYYNISDENLKLIRKVLNEFVKTQKK